MPRPLSLITLPYILGGKRSDDDDDVSNDDEYELAIIKWKELTKAAVVKRSLN